MNQSQKHSMKATSPPALPKPPPGLNQLLTPQQCAELLQIEVTTLYVMRSQGRIPYRKVGHLLRFDLEEILEWTKPKVR
jgi:excisionase family DNA binding protein